MSWNYRVVRHKYDATSESDWYAIHEVYYDAGGDIHMWAPEPHWPMGNDAEDLLGEMELMRQAFDKPVLNEEDMPGSSVADDNNG